MNRLMEGRRLLRRKLRRSKLRRVLRSMLRRWLRLLRLLWLLHGRVKLLLLLNGRRRMLLWLWWLLRCELMLQSVRLRRVGLLHRWLMSHRLDRLRLERRL